jgi:hypothetical protein
MTIEKAPVEITEKPKTAEEQAQEEFFKRLLVPVKPPPITETLEKVKQAIVQAQKAKATVKMTWYCTDCGRVGCQNDALHVTGKDHPRVSMVDGEFVDSSGNPVTGGLKTLMEKHAIPKVERGQSAAQDANSATLAKMHELKSK